MRRTAAFATLLTALTVAPLAATSAQAQPIFVPAPGFERAQLFDRYDDLDEDEVIPPGRAVRIINRLGFQAVSRPRLWRGQWVIEAVDRDGFDARVQVDAYSGEVLRVSRPGERPGARPDFRDPRDRRSDLFDSGPRILDGTRLGPPERIERAPRERLARLHPPLPVPRPSIDPVIPSPATELPQVLPPAASPAPAEPPRAALPPAVEPPVAPALAPSVIPAPVEAAPLVMPDPGPIEAFPRSQTAPSAPTAALPEAPVAPAVSAPAPTPAAPAAADEAPLVDGRFIGPNGEPLPGAPERVIRRIEPGRPSDAQRP
ncbi:MAG: hypothetical protein WCH83_01350 [Alphaproteobacteria bacterium]